MAKVTCDVIYLKDNCLNTKRPIANPCRICFDSCPHKAIEDSMQIKADHCTECGLCMSICPSDGFVNRMYDELLNYVTLNQSVSLNCPQAIRMDFEIPCLGIFDKDSWGSLLIMAREKPVSIYTGECGNCLDKQACKKSIQTLKEYYSEQLLNTSLKIRVSSDSGDDLNKAQPPKDNSNKESGLSRRQELTGWLNQNKRKLEDVLPSLINTKGYLIPKSRKRLIQLLQDRTDIKIPFKVPTISDCCTSCGICTLICPQNALQKMENGDSIKIILEPYKCVQCNRCIDSCRPQAMKSEMKHLSYKYLTGKVLLHEGIPLNCSCCGKQIFENNDAHLCIACASNNTSADKFL
ncbi:4Fe-4S binding protein [Desulfosporosinus sp. FKA]|uniref:4Fe-4S dicluster domain-containing protein n=1 Tax=Desulfosporosinus sp. FKA TaxID=1969834 RepID=UPI000B49C830|nr:4Fe-4S binding protein [Desulfosporosinus sp. FKA]